MQTLSEQVTTTLRDWILHGRLRPGARIEEIPIAQTIGVSRTPVRAALATLASEGLIDHQPNRGYSVRVFDLDTIMAAYEVRACLEGLACRNAALRGLSAAQTATLKRCLVEGDAILGKGTLDPADHLPYQQINVDLHTTILGASGNPWVERFAEQAHKIPFASDRIVLWDDHAIIQRSHGDHHRIVEAIIERDALRAEQLMREHVYYAGVILKNNFRGLLDGRVELGAPMKYEVNTHGHRLEAIGAHSGHRIRMSTLSAEGLETWPVSVYVRGSESEAEVKVDVPKHHLGSPTEAFDFGYRCATLWIDALDHRLT